MASIGSLLHSAAGMPISSSAKRDALAVGIAVLAGTVLLFPGALLRGEMFFERDLNFDWYLRLAAVARAIRERALPLWDPGVTFGQPLFADPGTQVLYPTTWLGLLLPRPLGYTAFVVLHLLLAALGAWRLARAWGASRLGAVLTGLAWAFCGPLQSLVNLRQHLAGTAWMAWALLAGEKVAVRPGLASGVGLALVLGLQVLAGSADTCAMTWVLVFAWILVRSLSRRAARGDAVRVGATALGAGTLVVLATAVVWMPALDVLRRSPRRDLTADVREAWSLPIPGLTRLAVPLDPVRVSPDPDERRMLYDRGLPFLSSLYLGAPLLGLAAIPLVARPRPRATPFLLCVGVGAVALALGRHAVFYPLAATLFGPLRILRYPSKLAIVAALAVALLAGLGCSVLGRGRVRRVAGLGLAALLVLASPLVLLLSRRYGPAPAVSSAIAAATAAVLLTAHATRAVRSRLVAAALAAVTVTDLVAVHAGLHATAPESVFFTPPALLSFVDRTGGRRLYVYDYSTLPESAPQRLGRVSPFPTIAPPPGWDPRVFVIAAVQSYLLPPWAALFGVAPAFEFDMRGLYSRDLNDLTFFLRRMEGRPAHARLLATAGVGTVVSLHTRGLEGLWPVARLPSVFPEAILVWRVPGDPRRTRVVGCARDADAGAAFEALATPGFDPSAEAIVPSPPSGLGPCGPAGESRLVFEGADRVRLEVEAVRAALVVLADTWDPGWRASVDGRAATVLRANVAFRAVAVPPGRHVVAMVYRPRAVALGLALSVAGLGLGIVAFAASRRTRAR
jgi:hypothetical protein